jgi:lipoate-protein ligase A
LRTSIAQTFPGELTRSTWRLLDTGLRSGATNMAIDEAILWAVAEGRSPPTLRFYGWEPPCVSVGYAQRLRGEVDLELCQRKGYHWVRRPTGGRAVLHIDELTYSVTVPQVEPRAAGDILTSYRRLSLGLVAGLKSLGCDASQAGIQVDGVPGDASAACFEVASDYEVTALGRKLIGSAQTRRRGVVLQHGALPLTGDVSRLVEVLVLASRDRGMLRERLLQSAIALDEATGRSVTYREAAGALAAGFAQALNLALEPGGLSLEERASAAQLRARYAGNDWTFSR